MPKAYSYIRFSTPEQAKGNSIVRQTEAAAKYARDNGLTLDESVTYLDAGVSGFKGENAETGMLAAFLRAVETGIIEEGSYLLVENLDRISRQNVARAASRLTDICYLGITVITLNDGKRYSREVLEADSMAFIMAVLVFSRAHEESATKSKRGLDNWRRKRDSAIKLKKPITKRVPAWLQLSADRQEIIPVDDRVAIVRELYQKHLDGVGIPALAIMLNERGIECWGEGGRKARQWHQSYVKKILSNPAVIGQYTPYTLAERKKPLRSQTPLPPMPNYYPAIIDEESFYRVQDLHKDHKLRGKKTSQEIQSIFARLARCPYCGQMMTRVNKGSRWQYLVCTTAKMRKGCYYVLVPYARAEEALLNGIFHAIPADTHKRRRIASEINSATVRISEIEKDIENYLEAVRTGTRSNDDEVLNFDFETEAGGKGLFVRRLFEEVAVLEANKKQHEDRIAELRASSYFSDSSKVAAKIAALSSAKEAASKAEINKCLHDLLSKIVIDYDDEGYMFLHFKHSDKVGKIRLEGYKSPIKSK